MKELLLALVLAVPSVLEANDSSVADVAPRVKFTETADMCFQMRGSFNLIKQHGSKLDSKFRMDDFRWNIEGNIGKKVYYRFRQSFTTAFRQNSWDNFLSSVNYAFIRWRPISNLALTAGKQVFSLGGYEFEATPVYVISFSDFGSSLSAYQFGLSAGWEISPTQQLVVQMCNLRGVSDNEYYYGGLPEGVTPARFPYMYTLNWNGRFLEDRSLEFRYSASYGHQAVNKGMWVLSFGHSYRRRTWGAYLDLMWSRQALDASSIMSESLASSDTKPVTATNTQYLSTVAYLHFFISPSFRAFVKGACEAGGFYKQYSDGLPGISRFNWNAQGSVQYMPTKNSNFRLFAHYNFYNRHPVGTGKSLGITSVNEHKVSLGLIYVMNVF